MNERAESTAGDAADARARERALDVTRSFLVQAPAGSGKTELLIQRFLALLTCVDRPERVVAITFTRKAAGEMRDRIVAALRDAADGKAVVSPHEQRTRALAIDVLAQDARHDWQLAAHPARLSVQTIDALCAGLARQAPLATRLGATPRYEERAEPLYAQAARDALAAASADDPHWQRVLAHLDNDAGEAVKLLAAMLARRDQWRGVLDFNERAGFRAALEASLVAEISGELREIANAFPPSLAAALMPHQRVAAKNLHAADAGCVLARQLETWAGNGGLPPATPEAGDDWHALADWLLVKEPQFRRKVAADLGFPAKGKGEGAAERDRHNQAMTAVFGELATVPGLAHALDAARGLPPARYGEDAWAIVSAVLAVLPQVVANLTVVFGEKGVVDFAQGMFAALDALGTDDAPSNLLLRLDLRIEHLLVDEFQDTSYPQLELISRLTSGWQSGDGRTLFAVGDPMQSIYRFREAEVRLFVEAQTKGQVGGIEVERLTLGRNFRSQAGLVDWVNETFPQVLGSRSDPWRSTVAFAPSLPVAPALPGSAATLDVLRDDAAEASTVVEHIRAALAEGPQSVAVLVRARTHLHALLPALRAAGIRFAAVDLDALAERQAVLDLESLTHALLQPADRLAWLSVLRAPWCGLTLSDLFALAGSADADPIRSIPDLLGAPDSVAGLSEDGRRRFSRAAGCLQPALAMRGRMPLAPLVRGAWLALGGPATLDEPIDIDAAERFLALLAAHESAGDVPDWAAFVAALEKLHAEADSANLPQVPVQVMTLHRAKGLEFDTVIVPGLARAPNRGGEALLRWRRRPNGLLLAPARAKGGDSDPIYAYIRHLAIDEERAELGRLLYVGCTRAKRRLHLTAVLDAGADAAGTIQWKPPRGGSGLACLWQVLGASLCLPAASADSTATKPSPPPPLVRLPATWAPNLPDDDLRVDSAMDDRATLPSFDWARETARHTGTVAHRVFAQMAREGLAAWDAERIARADRRIRLDLESEGVPEAERETAAAQIAMAIRNISDDDRGRWLFAPSHGESMSEWALAGVEGAAIAHLVLDRSFVADGVRWIIDMKTSAHEGADVDAFLDREVDRYRGQLERYARFVRALDQRPIRLALYYPLLRGWREWPYVD